MNAISLKSPMLAGLAYQGGATLVAHLPEALARRLGRLAAIACWHLSPRRAGRLAENLRRLRPELPARALRAEARHAFAGFGESVVDTLLLSRAPGADLERRVSFEGWERLEAAVRQGGAVLLGAHAGNWEWAGAAMAKRGIAVAAPARRHRGAERFFHCLRQRFGVRTARRIAPLLRGEQPRAVALFLDRGGEGEAAARPARVAGHAAALAARRGWTLLPAVCLSTRSGYRIVFGPALHPRRARAARRGDARAAVAFLESQLRAHRGQWFAFESLES